jgi:hypothetical protein
MVNRQKDHLQCQTDQSQMSSIGSPTPLSGPKLMTRSSSQDCNEWTAITQEEKMEDVQITQSTNDNLVE